MAFVRLLILEERLWCGGLSTSINVCGVWGGKGRSSNLQEGVSHTYIFRLG